MNYGHFCNSASSSHAQYKSVWRDLCRLYCAAVCQLVCTVVIQLMITWIFHLDFIIAYMCNLQMHNIYNNTHVLLRNTVSMPSVKSWLDFQQANLSEWDCFFFNDICIQKQSYEWTSLVLSWMLRNGNICHIENVWCIVLANSLYCYIYILTSTKGKNGTKQFCIV